jgi:hypothetical protein
MPTNRLPRARKRKARITPEVVALFKRAIAIEKDGDDEVWEADGGRCREYLDTSNQLRRLLGVRIWEPSVLDAAADMDLSGVPEHMLAGWTRAMRLRRALEAALEVA